MTITKTTLTYFTLLFVFFLAGCSGEDGEIGPQGEQGSTGQDGQDGADGQDGQNGADGQDGANGQDGATTFFLFEDFQDDSIPEELVQSSDDNLDWQIFFFGTPEFASGTAFENDNLFMGSPFALEDNQSTSISITFNNEIPALVQFDAFISSEIDADFLTWSLNGEMINGLSGREPSSVSGPFRISFEVPTGQNELTFAYSKNGAISTGNDVGAIDNLAILNFRAGRSDLSLPELPEGVSFYKQ